MHPAVAQDLVSKELVTVTVSSLFSVSVYYHLIAGQHLVINIACPTPIVI